MISAWLGMLIVLSSLGLLLGTVRYWQGRSGLHPELSRKIVHVGMGLVTLSFPWLFATFWPVLALAAVSVALLVTLKTNAALKARLGGVLNSVERASYGDVYFPIAVAALFVISKGGIILFCIPILILTFGDAIAALIGLRYGFNRYEAEDGPKSAEGSITFFTIAFLSVHIPLLLFTHVGRAECLLIGLTLGLLATLLEAIAWRGLDNLFIPLGVYVLLRSFLPLTWPVLALRLGVALGLVLFVVSWRERTTLRHSASLGAALTGYVCWAVGGWHWLVAPLIVFLAYPLLSPATKTSRERTHSIHSVLSVGAAGLGWLLIANWLNQPDLIFPYTLSFAIQLALIGIVRFKHHSGLISDSLLIVKSVAKSCLLLFIPFVITQGMSRLSVLQMGLGFGAMLVAAIAFALGTPRLGQTPTDHRLLIRQAGFAALGSLFGFLALPSRAWS